MKNNQEFSIELKPNSIRRIEEFVDTICEQLFINDTYYGNILISITEFFNYLIEHKHNDNSDIRIVYFSDYKTVNITFYPIDNQLITLLSAHNDIDTMPLEGDTKSLFVLFSLVDKISINENNSISFEFDISAVHNSIYNSRSELLKIYFEKNKVKISSAHNV